MSLLMGGGDRYQPFQGQQLLPDGILVLVATRVRGTMTDKQQP